MGLYDKGSLAAREMRAKAQKETLSQIKLKNNERGKKMKTRIYVSMLVIALTAALIGGATMAWFTDTAVNTGNTFSAGTIDIDLVDHNGNEITTPIFNFTDIAPGWVSRTVTVNMENAGTLPMRVRGTVSGQAIKDNDIALYGALLGRYKVFLNGGAITEWSDWLDVPSLPIIRTLTRIESGDTLSIDMEFQLPTTTGNAAQGGKVTLDLNLIATQIENLDFTVN